MKFIARVFGTWMIALAVVLIVVDGTKSLAADAMTLTSLGSLWASLHPQSWEALQAAIALHLAPLSLDGVAEAVFSVPSWAAAGLLGVVALIVGRKRRKTAFADPL